MISRLFRGRLPPRASKMKARQARIARWLLDTLLIPLAVIFVLLEDVLWNGTRRLLRMLDALPPVQAARARLAVLPASVVLPLFLVPEALSHLAAAYAAILLAEGRLHTATAVLVLGKGGTTLATVWIYRVCEPTLLRVAWFARLRGWALRVRDWALTQVRPIRSRLRTSLSLVRYALLDSLFALRTSQLGGGRVLQPRFRLRAWRAWLSARAGLRRQR